jgi:hypothetical protein
VLLFMARLRPSMPQKEPLVLHDLLPRHRFNNNVNKLNVRGVQQYEQH